MKILLCFIIIIIFKNINTQYNNDYHRAVLNNINFYNKVQNINSYGDINNYDAIENPFSQNHYTVFNNLQHNVETINYPTLHYSGNHKPFIIPELKEKLNFINHRTNPTKLIAAPPQGRSLGGTSFAGNSITRTTQYSNKELPIIGNRFGTDDSLNNEKPAESFQYQFTKDWSVNEGINVDNLILPHLEDHKYLKYSTPNRPDEQYYQQFYNIYNYVEHQGKQDLSQFQMDSINDDFNGRSIVAPGQYPHMAAIGFLSNEEKIEFKCGGSLISKIFVVTAAHCCYLSGETPIIVKLGIINLKNQAGNSSLQRKAIKEIIVHPSYNATMNYHDIALLKLQTPVEITKFVRPILLWTSDQIPYERVFTMGYGSTSFAKAPTNILTELSLSIVPLDKCKKTLPSDEKTPRGIVDSQICGRDLEKNRDTCQGDSGGPLQLNLEHLKDGKSSYRYYLVGVISYGEFCGSKQPGVYTRISSYCKWIASIVWPNYIKSL